MLARRVLSRLDKAKAAAQQRQFIDDAAVAALDKELRRWATEPVDPLRLLARLEQYERAGSASDASSWPTIAELSGLFDRVRRAAARRKDSTSIIATPMCGSSWPAI